MQNDYNFFEKIGTNIIKIHGFSTIDKTVYFRDLVYLDEETFVVSATNTFHPERCHEFQIESDRTIRSPLAYVKVTKAHAFRKYFVLDEKENVYFPTPLEM